MVGGAVVDVGGAAVGEAVGGAVATEIQVMCVIAIH